MFQDEWQRVTVSRTRLKLVKQIVLKTQGRWNPGKIKELLTEGISLRTLMQDFNWTNATTATLITIKDMVDFHKEEKHDEAIKNLLKNVEPVWYHQHVNLSVEMSKLKISDLPKAINSFEHLKFDFSSIKDLKNALQDNYQQIQDFLEKDIITISKKVNSIELHMRGNGVVSMFNCLQSECGICFNISGNSFIRAFPSPWKERLNARLKEKCGRKMKTYLSNEGPGRKDSQSRSILLQNGETVILLPTGCFHFEQKTSGVQLLIQFEVLTEDEKDAKRFDYVSSTIPAEKSSSTKNEQKRKSDCEVKDPSERPKRMFSFKEVSK